MKKPKKIRYYLFRYIIVAVLFYFLLVSPITSIMVIKNSPEVAQSLGLDSTALSDMRNKLDSVEETGHVMDEIIHNGYETNVNQDDSTCLVGYISSISDTGGVIFEVEFKGSENEDPFRSSTNPIFQIILLVCIVITIVINLPFKRFLRKKRKQKNISPKLKKYCRKNLIRMPWINSLILIFVFLIRHLLDYLQFYNPNVGEGVHQDIMSDFYYISVISALLVVLFSYFWQKNRLHQYYIKEFFTDEELRKSVFKYKRGRIRNKLWLAQGVTTLLPLMIVFFYMFISTTRVENIGLENLSYDHAKIIFGSYLELAPFYIKNFDVNFMQSMIYVNAVDTVLTILGIIVGIIVALIYILFFVKWTNLHITKSVEEVVDKMKLAADKKEYQYAIVRNNDEFGKLTEGYNDMTLKINNYIGEIEEMNKGLEKKVRERTAEIEAQRDEILAQRDEIEAQRDEIAAQRDTATQQRDLIAGQKKEITDSINYAKRIQNATMPDEILLGEIVDDFFIYYHPRDIVSGDFYWFTKTGDHFIIACADCTGHGVPGAFMSMLGTVLLKEIVIKENVTHPGKILQLLREEIIRSLKQSGKQGEDMLDSKDVKDGMDIALCSINMITGALQFAGAHNPLYIIKNLSDIPKDQNKFSYYQAVKNNSHVLYEVKADKMPISIYVKMDSFKTHDIQLDKGDQLYFFTDGYADQFGGPKGKKFKYKPFKELILNNCTEPLVKQRDILVDTFSAWKGNYGQVDDVLIMGIKF